MIGVAGNIVPGGSAGPKMVTLMGRTMPLDQALKLVAALRPAAESLAARLNLGVFRLLDAEGTITIALLRGGTTKTFEIGVPREDFKNGLLGHFWSERAVRGDMDGVLPVMLLELGHKLGLDFSNPANAAQALQKLLTVIEK